MVLYYINIIVEYSIVYYIILYYTILYYIILHCIIQYYIIYYYIILYNIISYYIPLYYCIILYFRKIPTLRDCFLREITSPKIITANTRKMISANPNLPKTNRWPNRMRQTTLKHCQTI